MSARLDASVNKPATYTAASPFFLFYHVTQHGEFPSIGSILPKFGSSPQRRILSAFLNFYSFFPISVLHKTSRGSICWRSPAKGRPRWLFLLRRSLSWTRTTASLFQEWKQASNGDASAPCIMIACCGKRDNCRCLIGSGVAIGGGPQAGQVS